MLHQGKHSGASDADFLKADDSILEPSAADAYERFIDSGGQVEEAKEFFCEGYEGFADIVNLAVSWVEIAGGDGDAVVDEAVKQQLLTSFSANRADDAFLRTTESESRPSAFLDELNRSSTWQPVVLELASKHKTSSLLYYMKQRDGLSALDAAIADSPEKFISSFVQLIDGLVSRKTVTEDDLRTFYDVARQRASYDENTLVLALRLIAEVTRAVEDANMKSVLRRCSQEIRIYARKSMSQVAHLPDHMALQFTTRIAIALDAHSAGVTVPKGVLSAISAILSSDKAKLKKQIGGYKEEIHVLNQVYKPLVEDDGVEEPATDPLPEKHREAIVHTLCHPEIFYGMIRTLFVQSARTPNAETGRKAPLDDELRDCLSLLVALATVAIRDRSRQMDGQALDLGDSKTDVQEFEHLLRGCVKCCENIHPGCARKTFEKGNPLSTLHEGIQESSVIAYGVVNWAREGLLKDPEPKMLVRTAIKYLALLEFVGEKHPALREEVLSVFADAYGHQLYARNDINRVVEFERKLRNLYSDALVCLLRQRMATRVVQLYRTRFADDEEVDRSYLRKFVGDVLEVVAPKYSGTFASALLDLLGHRRVIEALGTPTNRDRDVAARVMQFLGDIEDATTFSQLDRKTVMQVRQAYRLND